eukprot:CAMPEP_0113308232 /NCGR_PEP_ID=MMETSP0010_2-20120614/6750_1 /TAXON_ID=216773 ORGANISM="Corethron hystrix, Strain 308" /NCGR_SAMPLE_ID=MMETSP0010_2 /ASSEMBLY_ACC=CAM_ASM_000155 /LENGTH=243 /DNA_ID=CAMNT_0000163227 /DNA_START=177 /DNA_END=908 /DNA_ORIENTATION=- /assembly_acc=CAM_ASM_000155
MAAASESKWLQLNQSFPLIVFLLTTTRSVHSVGASHLKRPSLKKIPHTPAFNIFDKIRGDFLALTRKCTARHILLPPKSTEAALTLKQKIRNRVSEDNEFVVDAFSAAAVRFSRDETTANSGGLLGTLIPQGYIVCQDLDRACFEVPLGEVCGPIESEYGIHLLLVSERTNCQKLDGQNWRIIRGDNNEKIFAPPEGGYKPLEEQMAEFTLGQVAFWVNVCFAGGILAEVTARVIGAVEDTVI